MQAAMGESVSNAAAQSRCPACGVDAMRVFFEVARAPVFCNILCSTRDEAFSVPAGTIRLGHCTACSMVYNVAFDERLMRYGAAYENSLQFSPRFQAYIGALAAGLVERHGLRGKDVIEIGCGQGDFLSLVCEKGGNRGLGFDPSFDPTKSATIMKGNVTVIPEYYSDAHVDRPVDLLCCRHVLEHIPEPLVFLRGLRRVLGDRTNTLLFFEVPNALYTLRRLGIWDIIYEHCSYFTPASLAGLFRRAGFEPIATAEAYDGQFLSIEARLRPVGGGWREDNGEEALATEQLVHAFGDAYRAKCKMWQHRLLDIARRGQRAVIWGAGSKGVTFLNVLEAGDKTVPYAVDLNPRKHGRFVVVTGQEIVAPQFLRDYRPDVILIMNGIYESEIARICNEMNLSSELLLAA